MCRKSFASSLVSIMGLLLLNASLGFASGEIQVLFLKKYPGAVKSQLDSCATCHSPNIGNGLNGYGLTLKANNLNFTAVEGLDPDKDGVTTGEEIKASQFPGSWATADGLFVFVSNFGKITFDHRSHVTQDKYVHMDNDGVARPIGGRCAICHAGSGTTFEKIFDNRPEFRDTVKETVHEVCKGCHETSGNENAPTDCMKCHTM